MTLSKKTWASWPWVVITLLCFFILLVVTYLCFASIVSTAPFWLLALVSTGFVAWVLFGWIQTFDFHPLAFVLLLSASVASSLIIWQGFRYSLAWACTVPTFITATLGFLASFFFDE